MRNTDFSSLLRLPEGSVVSVCGAGGKTTLIHDLRDACRGRGLSVLVTTSTHMMNEGGLLSGADGIRRALLGRGYAFAGRPDPANADKIIGLPEETFAEVRGFAGITLVEADGARRMRFKVPYPHEPVILPGTTCVIVVYGASAAGMTIREACYNPEGVSEVLGVPDGALLTEEMMREAIEKTYVRRLRKSCPGVPVCIYEAGGEAR